MVKIVSLAILFAITIVYLKSVNSELAPLALVGSGIIIVFLSLDYLMQTVDFFKQLVSLTGLGEDSFSTILKVTAIGYLVEFGASTIEDMGIKNLSDKLVFVGKIIIFTTSLPIFYAVFNLLKRLMI